MCIKISVWRCVKLSKNIPLTEENQAARIHFTNKALKSSIVFMFLSSLQHFLVLSKQTHFGSCILPLKNLRTASQGQHQIAKAEKSTEQKIVLFSPRYSCRPIVHLLCWQLPMERGLSLCRDTELNTYIKEGLKVVAKYRTMKKAREMRHWCAFSIPAEVRNDRRLLGFCSCVHLKFRVNKTFPVKIST